MKTGTVRRIPGQRRVTPRGATRQVKRSRVSPGLKRGLQRLFWLVVVLALLGAGYYGLSELVKDWLDRPVTEVSVEGNFRHLGQERIEQVLGQQLAVGFLRLDLARVKEVVEQEPWVESASLRRRWPDQVQVKIVEQDPIARWGDSGFLNRRGEIVKVQNVSVLTHLPELEGLDRDASRMMERYQDLAQLLRSRGLTIRSLRSDEKGAWRLELNDGVGVAIGRDRVLLKMQRFTSVFDQLLSDRWEEVKSVDLRYQSGVAVSWKTLKENEQ